MRQDVLDRLVSENRPRRVAEILFPDERPDVCKDEDCFCCRMYEKDWLKRITQVRAAIQSTFTLSVDTPTRDE